MNISAIRKEFNSWHTASQLFFLICLLNFLDFYTTKLLVDKNGYDVEGNPFLRLAMYELDTTYAILYIKVFFLSFCGYWYHQYIKSNLTTFKWLPLQTITLTFWALAIVFLSICVNNLILVYLSYS